MIEIHQLQKVIDQNTVVDIDQLRVEPGEVVALVGPAGSGKGDLLNLLIGNARPTAGTVRLGGSDPKSDRDGFSRQVGVLFYEDGLYGLRTPLANLLFHCKLRGMPRA